MAHHCHATDCERTVPPVMFMCKPHWFKLPKPMRDRIWAAYEDGQCDTYDPSGEYCQAAKAAVIYIAEKEGRKPDTRLYDFVIDGGDLPAVMTIANAVVDPPPQEKGE